MYEYITFDDVREISHLLSFEKESYTVDIYIKNNNAARILKEMIEKLSGIKAENFSTHYQFNNRKVDVRINLGVEIPFLARRANIVICDDGYSYQDLTWVFDGLVYGPNKMKVVNNGDILMENSRFNNKYQKEMEHRKLFEEIVLPLLRKENVNGNIDKEPNR